MTLTAEQLRAARAMLRMEQTELAKKSGVSTETIKRLEAGSGELKAKFETLRMIRIALEFSGIVFTDDEGGPGIRLASDPTDAFVDAMTKEFAGLFRVALQQEFRKNAHLYKSGNKADLAAAVLKQVATMMRSTLPGK